MNPISVQDQTGKFVFLPAPAERIVSLVPSLTELLYHLHLSEEVVGITKFCVHPSHWHRTKTRVGGTKNVQLQKVQQLQPQLVLAAKEENLKEQVEPIRNYCPVYTSNVVTLNDALQLIGDIGALTGRTKNALQLAKEIQTAFAAVNIEKRYRALYLIWKDPWMGAGYDTFINSMLQAAGFTNVLHNRSRYPALTPAEMQALQPDVVLLSSEPYPFQEKHIDEVKKILPQSNVLLADGTYFSWYGSRMRHAPAYFVKLTEQLHL